MPRPAGSKNRPKAQSSEAEKEMDRLEAESKQFNEKVKELSDVNKIAALPVQEFEPQTKLSNREINKAAAPMIKPSKVMFSVEKFNEKYREEYNAKRKYVRCIVENKEVRGEMVETWYKNWPGTPAEFYQLPVNKPIQIPIYLADHMANRAYTRIVMDETTGSTTDSTGTWRGVPVADVRINRIECKPAQSSFFSMAG